MVRGFRARPWRAGRRAFVGAAIAAFVALGLVALGMAAAHAQSPPSTVVSGDVEQAKYDEAALRALHDRCKAGSCSADITTAIDTRIAVAAKERAQFAAAQTEADYKAYLSSCVACTYRTSAQQVLQNMKTTAAPPTSQPAVAPPAAPGIAPPPAAGNKWHAIARVVYRVRGNARVSVGYSGTMATPLEAEQAAKQRCESSADGNECDVGTAQNSGCLYITTGRTRRGVIETSGASIQEAYDRCVGAGYQCQQPIGGCLQ